MGRPSVLVEEQVPKDTGEPGHAPRAAGRWPPKGTSPGLRSDRPSDQGQADVAQTRDRVLRVQPTSAWLFLSEPHHELGGIRERMAHDRARVVDQLAGGV